MTIDKFNKNIAFLLLILIGVIGLMHAWHPITLSPADGDGRLSFTLLLLFLVWACYAGYRYARLLLGGTFAFCGAVNLLILLAYFNSMPLSNLLKMLFLTVVLSILSCFLLAWKGMRVFEESKQKQLTTN